MLGNEGGRGSPSANAENSPLTIQRDGVHLYENLSTSRNRFWPIVDQLQYFGGRASLQRDSKWGGGSAEYGEDLRGVARGWPAVRGEGAASSPCVIPKLAWWPW